MDAEIVVLPVVRIERGEVPPLNVRTSDLTNVAIFPRLIARHWPVTPPRSPGRSRRRSLLSPPKGAA